MIVVRQLIMQIHHHAMDGRRRSRLAEARGALDDDVMLARLECFHRSDDRFQLSRIRVGEGGSACGQRVSISVMRAELCRISTRSVVVYSGSRLAL
jgi:hypothetical protein